MTFLVSKDDKSILLKLVQPANIALIFVTFLVSKDDKLILLKLVQ